MRGLFRGLPYVGALGLILYSSNTIGASGSGSEDIFAKMSSGSVQGQTIGESFYLQSLIKKAPDRISEVVESDINQLGKLIPGLNYARTFQTKDGRKLLYMKVSGFLDGTGLMMEVKRGLDALFSNGATAVLDDNLFDFSSAEYNLSNPWQSQLDSAILQRSAKGEVANLSPAVEIVLEGPVNHVMDLNGLRVAILISMQQFNQNAVNKRDSAGLGNTPSTYLLTQFQFRKTKWTEEWGQFSSFGSREINLAQVQATKLMRQVQASLAAIQ